MNAPVARRSYRAAFVRAAILLMMVTAASEWSSPASAQLGSLIISVSAPAGGSTVTVIGSDIHCVPNGPRPTALSV